MTTETAAPRALLRRLYDWVLHWADTRYATPALFLLAFAESSFFPIPPDVLLLALALGAPKRGLYWAAVCTAGSVLGGLAGYYIGFGFQETVGARIIDFYGVQAQFAKVGELYKENLVLALGTAAFTPIPYKVFTIAGGVFQVDLIPFTLTSIAGRGARFFMVAGMIYAFGPRIKAFIDKYFNLLTVVFFVLLVGGFVLVKKLAH